ncbi:hypothetical protein X777_01960, partial [Ooceraea biroi]
SRTAKAVTPNRRHGTYRIRDATSGNKCQRDGLLVLAKPTLNRSRAATVDGDEFNVILVTDEHKNTYTVSS